MKLNKAYKFRLYPNSEQIIMFEKTFGCTRFIYNQMLSDKIKHYEITKQKLNNTPAQYKNEFVWLKEVDSLALANAQMNLQTAYNNFFRSPKVGFPKYKSKKKNKFSYTTNNQGGNIHILDNKIKLPKIGYVKIKQDRVIPSEQNIKSCTISKTPTGKYYISILVEYEKQIIQSTNYGNAIGLDFAMNGLFVDSNNECADYPRFYRNTQKKLAKQQKRLSKKKKGSNNRNKQRIKVARTHEKIANQRKDFLHKQSTKIVNLYDVVCIEDLNMQAMARTLNFGKSVSDNGWGMFTQFLNYKLKERGKYLIKIDKWFPSTKTCSSCGNIREMKLSDRVYVCECGLVIDRDYNSAINIKNEGLRLLLS